MKLRYRIVELRHDLFEVQMQMVGFWGKILGWCYVGTNYTLDAAQQSCLNNLRWDLEASTRRIIKNSRKKEKVTKVLKEYEPLE